MPDAETTAALAAALEGMSDGRIEGASGADLVADLVRFGGEGGRFDVLGHAAALGTKPVLSVSGARDRVVSREELHEPLLAALGEGGNFRAVVLDADHSFSSKRIALARSVAGFLNERCVSSR